MPPRNHNNNKKEVFKELEKTISPILVVNNPSLKPYVELFEYYPENIYQQALGSLVGFFEIKEYSEDSAYIVNFLTSVLKKEYYINPKRAVTESLDSALHKVNLALSEIAKQGNVEWLGNLNAAICVLEKNNAHFSVAGKAKIFLYRNTILTDIGDGLAADSSEPHPLKTFVNVSSGRLEKDDHMLITSEDIFHILSTTEIKKNFQRFKGEKFVQFLKTALSNQLELIATLVVQMSDAKTVNEMKTFSSRKKSSATVNVFSEKTFAKSPAQAETIETVSEINANEDDSDYTDKKTGHIYVQGEANGSDENSRANMYWDMTKEKIAQGWYSLKNDLKRRFSMYKKQLEKKRQLRQIEKEKERQALEEKLKREQAEKAIADMKLELEMKEAEGIRKQHEPESIMPEQVEKNEEIIKVGETIESEGLSFREKLEIAMKQQPATAIEENVLIEDEIEPEEQVSKTAIFVSFAKKTGQKIVRMAKAVSKFVSPTIDKAIEKIKQINIKDAKKIYGFIPHASKIKKLFSSFTFNQKIYTLCALVLIFIVPIFIVRFLNRPKTPTITQLETIQPTLSEILTNEKNINLFAQKQTVLSQNDIVNTLVINTGTAIVTKNSVVVIENGEQKEYALPENSGATVKAAFMKDLSLVFILTDKNKLISFSPVSTKFTDRQYKPSNKCF
jgi:hypothetical protein